MMRWLRRLVWLGVLAGAAFAAYRMLSQRQAPSMSAPEWPPLSPEPRPATAETRKAAAPAERWVPPVDGKCPDGYPLKANDNSGIFHEPGGRFYDRTVAERCYANADDAIADGYRPAKA
jgi:hypothetical protein